MKPDGNVHGPALVPVVFVWDEEGLCMRVSPRYTGLARKQFHDREEYPLVILEARSRESHNHYFASIHEGWLSLPEKIAPRFPSAEHLRKWSLIETGWCTDPIYMPCSSKKAALRTAQSIRSKREFAFSRIIVAPMSDDVDDETGEVFKCWPVIVRDAVSQSAKAMGKAEFEKSKRDVLDLIASMVKVPRAVLEQQARRRVA